MLTKSQWAARRADSFSRFVASLKKPGPNINIPTVEGVSAQPCIHRGCLQYPATHSHAFSVWPDPRNASKYEWEGKVYEEPANLTSEIVTADGTEKCKAPRTRCKINQGDNLWRNKATGLVYCKKHTVFAVYGPDIIERVKALSSPP